MKELTQHTAKLINGAGIPMPVPKLNGPTVSKETSDFFGKYGVTMAAGAAGSAVGAAAGALGGPVGSIIGGAIGAVVGSVIHAQEKPQDTAKA